MCGFYDINYYSRARILYKGLKSQKVEVKKCLPRKRNKYKILIKRLLKKDFDIIVATGKICFLICWLFKPFHRKKIVFDFVITDYDTLVRSRKKVKKDTIRAKLIWLSDKIALKLSDKVMGECNEFNEQVAKEYDIKKEKFSDVVLGADEDIFYPRKKKKSKKFTIYYHGTFIPHHGLEYVVEAAKLLKKEKQIMFKFIGEGQTYNEMKELSGKYKLKNVEFLGFQKITNVPKMLAEADLCLGIFKNSIKAKRHVTHKIFEVLAIKKPLLTGNSPATTRILNHLEHCYFCKLGDAKSLAKGILYLKKNPKKRKKIAEQGYKKHLEEFTYKKIGLRMKEILEDILD